MPSPKVIVVYIFYWLDGTIGKYMTTIFESLSHSKWDCKYHVVFVPKCRRKILYGKIRSFLKQVFHELAFQKNCKIISGNLVQDHVHMIISIPPKYAVSDVIGYLKGKSAIAVARQFGGKTKNFNGERLWARGYAVSTIGFEKEKIIAYVKHQEQLDGLGSEESGEF
jgi:REP-associated tyrosine transposase